MKAEIIAVGTEILLGDILNTNAQYLSKEQRQNISGKNWCWMKEHLAESKNISNAQAEP